MRVWALAIVVATSCSRVPEEPNPVVRKDPVAPNAIAQSTQDTPVAATPSTNAPPPTPPCPADPDPSKNGTLYEHGSATFTTPDGARHVFRVEIARTDAAQERGLMYRTSLADDAGMVFDFDQPHHAVFWMHNTCISLDMVFVSEDLRVIGVVTAPPLSDAHQEVPGFSKYVVELAAGVAKKRGIAIGTTFSFTNTP